MIAFIRHYLLAVQYFTRIPITGRLAAWTGYSPEALQSSASHFPGVGLLVGVTSAAALFITFNLLPASPLSALVASFFSAFCSIVLTGAFHEDGLADTADGLGGFTDRNRSLEIMRDSRLGTYGTVALILVVGGKIALLALLLSLNPLLTVSTLILGHVISRWISLLAMRLIPPIDETSNSKSKPLVQGIRIYHLVIGSLWPLATLFCLSRYHSLQSWSLAVPFALATGALLTRKYHQRLGGYNGDCLGALQQMCELAFYLGTVFLIGR